MAEAETVPEISLHSIAAIGASSPNTRLSGVGPVTAADDAVFDEHGSYARDVLAARTFTEHPDSPNRMS